MEDKARYSVVVPIYGVGNYLNKCVDSLINQTYKNIEIILVDDGAEDNSPAICDYYSSIDSRVKVIHKKNGGLVSARKAGARIAAGEYIFCVDGDDWVSLEYIERLDRVISQYNPDVVCCGYVQTDGATENRRGFEIECGLYDQKKLKRLVYPMAIESENGTVFPPQLWAKAFRRELYLPEQLSVRDEIKIGEDGAVVKPILTKCTSLYILDEYLYYYRVNVTSMTQNKSAYDWNGPRYIQRHLSERIDLTRYDYKDQIRRRTVRDLYTVTFSQFNLNEGYWKIRKNIVKNLSAADYKDTLRKCRYKGLKHKLEVFLLKHHLLLPIYLFHQL